MSEQIRIKVDTSTFSKAIMYASMTAAKEKENVLSNILISPTESKMTIISRNFILKLTQEIDIESDSSTSFLVDPSKLSQILKELKNPETTLELNEGTLRITNGSFKATLKTISSDLYPYEEPEERKVVTTIEFGKLKHMFRIASVYPDKKDLSREFTGVYVETAPDTFKCVATDHFRLININTQNENEQITNFITENAMATLIPKLDIEGEVNIKLGNNTAEISTENFALESKIIKGNFPPYESILLKDDDNIITIDRDEMIGAIRRVSVANSANEVKLTIIQSDRVITVEAENQEGENAKDTVKIVESNSDNDLEIKLNSRFLLTFLNQVPTESVEFFYRSAEEPIMLRSKDESFTYNYVMTPITE